MDSYDIFVLITIHDGPIFGSEKLGVVNAKS